MPHTIGQAVTHMTACFPPPGTVHRQRSTPHLPYGCTVRCYVKRQAMSLRQTEEHPGVLSAVSRYSLYQ